jgi:hypothetical protein
MRTDRLTRPIDFAAMPDGVNNDRRHVGQDFVDDPIIADPKLIEAGKLASQALRLDRVEILGQPADPLHDSSRDLAIESSKLAGCGLEDTKVGHRSGEAQLLRQVGEGQPSLAAPYLRSLVLQAFAKLRPQLEALVGISQHLGELGLDQLPQNFLELFAGHFGNRIGHHRLLEFILPDPEERRGPMQRLVLGEPQWKLTLSANA